MRKWKYNMDSHGKQLRELINSEEKTVEHVVKIYNQMIIFLNVWEKLLTSKDKNALEDDINSLVEDLACACPDVDVDIDYEAESENLNYYLDEFYSLCDYGSCWVGI